MALFCRQISPNRIALNEVETVKLGCDVLNRGQEVQRMSRQTISKEALRQSVVRSVEASARLEGRSVPTDFVRSERVERLLAKRRKWRQQR